MKLFEVKKLVKASPLWLFALIRLFRARTTSVVLSPSSTSRHARRIRYGKIQEIRAFGRDASNLERSQHEVKAHKGIRRSRTHEYLQGCISSHNLLPELDTM